MWSPPSTQRLPFFCRPISSMSTSAHVKLCHVSNLKQTFTGKQRLATSCMMVCRTRTLPASVKGLPSALSPDAGFGVPNWRASAFYRGICATVSMASLARPRALSRSAAIIASATHTPAWYFHSDGCQQVHPRDHQQAASEALNI